MCQFWEPCWEAGRTRCSVSLTICLKLGTFLEVFACRIVMTSFIAFVVGCMEEVCRNHDNFKSFQFRVLYSLLQFIMSTTFNFTHLFDLLQICLADLENLNNTSLWNSKLKDSHHFISTKQNSSLNEAKWIRFNMIGWHKFQDQSSRNSLLTSWTWTFWWFFNCNNYWQIA